MTFMKCSHGRHKANLFSLLEIFKKLILKIHNFIEYFHCFFYACL